MAAPSQQYPPWLTPFPTVVTDSAGTTTTSTTVLYLPLTYYGPSVSIANFFTALIGGRAGYILNSVHLIRSEFFSFRRLSHRSH